MLPARRLLAIALPAAALAAAGSRTRGADEAFVRGGVPHPGVDQILWTPTLVQAEEAARVTGKPIYLMGYVASWDGW